MTGGIYVCSLCGRELGWEFYVHRTVVPHPIVNGRLSAILQLIARILAFSRITVKGHLAASVILGLCGQLLK